MKASQFQKSGQNSRRALKKRQQAKKKRNSVVLHFIPLLMFHLSHLLKGIRGGIGCRFNGEVNGCKK